MLLGIFARRQRMLWGGRTRQQEFAPREYQRTFKKRRLRQRHLLPRKKKSGYEVDVYLVVAYGVKITEVVSEVQKKVQYVLEKTFQIPFNGECLRPRRQGYPINEKRSTANY
jgi:hypothetical protein